MSIELVSFADLKVFLDLNKDEVDYPDLTLIQANVVFSLEQFAKRQFEVVEREEIYVPVALTRMVGLPGLPVVSVSKVTIDDQTVEAHVPGNALGYKIMPYGIQLPFKVIQQEISVTYTGGLSVVPGTINKAALSQTIWEYQNKNNLGATSVSTEGGAVVMPELGLLKEVQRLLQSEIHPLVGA